MDECEIAISKIAESYREVVSGGLDLDRIEGSSDSAIDAMADSQNASAIPASAREIYRFIGTRSGTFLSICSFELWELDAEEKEVAMESLSDVASELNPIVDPIHMLVIMQSDAGYHAVIDGVDLDEPDPPVWIVFEGGTIERRDSVTSLFSQIARSVQDVLDL
ncbi:hypothetical protein [Nocardia sp. NPDC048505]|uniref:hypothetical protein n=1 Tax=unclassified Nocardia TaxID=2637762 RepID=UPI0033FC7F78